MAALYSIKRVIQRFGPREVLNIPELELQRGIIYVLQGPNGAGKTTFMRILSFMDPPAEGDLYFMGEKVQPEHAARYRARVVWVPQSPVMFTGTLLYNIEYPMRLKGVPGQERKTRAMKLLENVGLEKLAKAPAPRLSGGEAQRASIARALAAGAEVILFDEPTASVDYRSRGEIIGIIRSLCCERGLSIIVTTHDAALAEELAEKRITLFDGKLVPHAPGYPAASHSAAFGTSSGNLPEIQGRLELQGNACRLLISERENTKALPDEKEFVVRGMIEHNQDVLLHLVSAGTEDDSGELVLRLSDAESLRLARNLHLGGSLKAVRFHG